VKASAETYSPIGGKVSEVNGALPEKPETLNSDPYGAGWMIKVVGGDSASMMDATAYEAYCAERAH
jgi:glycine cleavage system H protein